MFRKHGTSISLVLAALVGLGCDEGRNPLTVEALPPTLSMESPDTADNLTGTACPEGDPDWVAHVTIDGCIIGGFADQRSAWQMLVYPVRWGPGVTIWAMIEHRESANGYGVRFLDAIEWTTVLDEDTTN